MTTPSRVRAGFALAIAAGFLMAASALAQEAAGEKAAGCG